MAFTMKVNKQFSNSNKNVEGLLKCTIISQCKFLVSVPKVSILNCSILCVCYVYACVFMCTSEIQTISAILEYFRYIIGNTCIYTLYFP